MSRAGRVVLFFMDVGEKVKPETRKWRKQVRERDQKNLRTAVSTILNTCLVKTCLVAVRIMGSAVFCRQYLGILSNDFWSEHGLDDP
jgi:hypothetical protein